MNIAVLSESPADEAAVRILIDSIIGQPTLATSRYPLRGRGFHNVLKAFPAIVRALHFQSDAEGIVVVVDSNGSEVHTTDHDDPRKLQDRCRFCHLKLMVQELQRTLRLPSHRQLPLRVAIGLAVPCIEAWYRCGLDAQVTEANWKIGVDARIQLYQKNGLKTAVYGSDRAGLSMMIRRASEEATRISKNLGQLRTAFPNGFGPLYDEVQLWSHPIRT